MFPFKEESAVCYVRFTRMNSEYKILQDNPLENVIIEKDPDDIFKWHFIIHDLCNCVYAGGIYYGTIIIPENYPVVTAKIRFLTPNGRFEQKQNLVFCGIDHPKVISMATWTVASMFSAIIEEMLSCVTTSDCTHKEYLLRQQLSKESIGFNMKNRDFVHIFRPYFKLLRIDSKFMIHETGNTSPYYNSKPSEKKASEVLLNLFCLR